MRGFLNFLFHSLSVFEEKKKRESMMPLHGSKSEKRKMSDTVFQKRYQRSAESASENTRIRLDFDRLRCWKRGPNREGIDF